MAAPFVYIAGPDDYLVDRAGREAFARAAEGLDDAFAQEVVSGQAGNLAEVEAAVARCREAVQTLGLFGGRKAVWFRGLTFLADTVTGRAEGTKRALELLQGTLAAVDPAAVAVVLTASPVDRRKAFAKWAEKTGESRVLAGAETEGGRAALAELVRAEAGRAGVRFAEAAVERLVELSGGAGRVVELEAAKLADHAGPGGEVTEADVRALTPNYAEGDFFEAAEAFYAADLAWALAAVRRHFFTGGAGRPLVSSLLGTGRLAVQARALVDAGCGAGRGALREGAARFGDRFGGKEKSAFNLFSQHPFRVDKAFAAAGRHDLRRLLDFQLEFARAFDELNVPGADEEAVLRALVVRCLG